jgi:hypothetical protein
LIILSNKNGKQAKTIVPKIFWVLNSHLKMYLPTIYKTTVYIKIVTIIVIMDKTKNNKNDKTTIAGSTLVDPIKLVAE